MSLRHYLSLFLFSLLVYSFVARFQSSPGYMDADYYFAGGLRLVGGYGFNEEILWNYLDDPTGLPHHSHTYWMPLTSILAAISMKITGIHQFSGARVVFLLLCTALPLVTAELSLRLNGRRDMAFMSGWLAIFSTFYLCFLPTIDVFAVYMIFGALTIILYVKLDSRRDISLSGIIVHAFALGLLAGLMHLARTDGILWLLISMLILALWCFRNGQKPGAFRTSAICFVLCLLGYLVIMGPWMLRNLPVFGTAFSPGGARALWVTNYDELFIYPGSTLTLARWWESGFDKILNARLWSMGQNFQTVLGVQGEIFLAPLILLGLWHHRHSLAIRTVMIGWLLTLATMTVIFPFQGARGGFFHSSAAFQPFFWVMAPIGLEVFLGWGNKRRGWNITQARRFFQISMICLAVLMSILVAYNKLRISLDHAGWNASYDRYEELEEVLNGLGASPDDGVMVNNSPGYYVASGRPSFSIPDGDLYTVMNVARRYQARYLLLEIDQIRDGADMFYNPGDRNGIHYLGTFSDVRLFEMVGP